MAHHKPPLPVDTGWAWLVMVGSFVNITIVISFNRAAGLFVTEFLDQFQESATATTVAFGASPIMFGICNILLPFVFLRRFCPRTLTATGGILAGISVTAMTFARSMSTMTVLFGIMGFAHGFVFVPQAVLLGFYFRKRLAFANAFAYMGMAVAAIVSPVVGKLLLDVYGLQGTLFLYGAFTFNIFPSALLFRPVSKYNVGSRDSANVELKVDENRDERTLRPLLKEETKEHESHPCDNMQTFLSENPSCEKENHHEGSVAQSIDGDGEESKILCTKANHESMAPDLNDECSLEMQIAQELTHIPSVENCSTINHFKTCSAEKETNICAQNEADKSQTYKKEINDLENTNLDRGDDVCVPISEHSQEANQYSDQSHMPEEMHLSDEKYVEVKKLDNALPEMETRIATSPENTCLSKDSNTKTKSHCLGRFISGLRTSVYGNPLAILLLLAAGLAVHTQATSTYLAALGEENGLSSTQVPYLLTMFGVFSLLGKLAIGYIADLKFCDSLYIVVAINLVLSGVMQVTRLCQSFGLMMALSISLGILTGVIDFMFPVMVSDMLGKEHIGHMMSGFLLINGILMSTDHVVVGALKDATGFFYISYHYMGVLVLLGVFLFMATPLVAKLMKKRNSP